MCVSMAPAEFKGAIAFGGEVDESLHLLGYQNSAQSLSGPNCMLLHVPTAELTADNLVPTTAVPNFMEDMGRRVYALWTFRGGMTSRSAMEPVVVHYGAYEIVLASSAKDVPSALERISPAKRPVINDELLAWFDKQRPNYSFALPCFNNDVEQVQHPILIKYVPTDPTKIFVPGLESHSGRPPVIGGRDHPRDFKVVFGSRLATTYSGRVPGHSLNDMRTVTYRDDLGELRDLLPSQVVGFRDNNVGTNSDYWASAQDVRDGLNYDELFLTMPAHAEGALI